MPQPVTTSELLLQEVAGLLTEIRDLLREGPDGNAQAPTEAPQKAPAKKATAPAAGRRAKATK